MHIICTRLAASKQAFLKCHAKDVVALVAEFIAHHVEGRLQLLTGRRIGFRPCGARCKAWMEAHRCWACQKNIGACLLFHEQFLGGGKKAQTRQAEPQADQCLYSKQVKPVPYIQHLLSLFTRSNHLSWSFAVLGKQLTLFDTMYYSLYLIPF